MAAARINDNAAAVGRAVAGSAVATMTLEQTTMATGTAMATMALEQTTMATSAAMVTTEAGAATAVVTTITSNADAAVAAVTGHNLVVGAQQCQADDRKESCDPAQDKSIHLQLLPKLFQRTFSRLVPNVRIRRSPMQPTPPRWPLATSVACESYSLFAQTLPVK